MSKRPRPVDQIMSDVISYGGLPVTRTSAYRLALEATEDKGAADLFAFGPQTRRLDCEPISYDEANALTPA